MTGSKSEEPSYRGSVQALRRPLARQRDQFLLPLGTVTFLLADIEGSTGLWESRGPDMGQAVARGYELAAEAMGLRGVRPEEQGEEDSFVAAFAGHRGDRGIVPGSPSRAGTEPRA